MSKDKPIHSMKEMMEAIVKSDAQTTIADAFRRALGIVV